MAIRLGAAGALTALLAGLTVPAQAAFVPSCGPIVDSIKLCTAPDGSQEPVMVNRPVAGPRPIIGGALLVGNTLTVYDGVWDPSNATLTHQWLRNDVPILGATGTTYRLTRSDLGKGIRVKTTGRAPEYKATTVQSAKTPSITDAAGAVPTVRAGSVGFEPLGVEDGEYWPVVVAQLGDWGPNGVQLRYQWLRDGSPIPGATAPRFDRTTWGPTGLLSLRVTGYAAGLDPVSVTSAASRGTFTPETPGAVVTGGTEVGDVLTAVDLPWFDHTGRNTSDWNEHRFQWMRDGIRIPDANELTYTITAEDQGHTLEMVTTSGGPEASSNAVTVPPAGGAVIPAPPEPPKVELKPLTNVTKPVLTGDAVIGTAMTATAGTWSEPAENLTVIYYWQSPDGKVSATGPTFTPNMTQLGTTVTLIATATAPGYTTAWAKVTAPKPVTAPDPTQTKAPAIRGNATVGMELYTYTGDWSFRDSEVKESRQWLRDGAPIAGATGRRYTLVGADFGKKISLRVTSTLDGRTLKIQTVDASAKVAAAALSSATPTIAGTVKAGTVVTANPGTWTWGTAFKYRWLRNGVPIYGATESTYKVRSADRDKRITVRVTGSRLGYTTVTQTSGAYFAR
ncbi:hypothetical protein [Arthrobacter sp. TE12232]